MKVKIMKRGTVFVLMFLLGLFVMEVPGSAKTSKWKMMENGSAWSRDESSPYTWRSVYLNDNDLWTTVYYEEKGEDHIAPTHNIITSWKVNQYQTLRFVTVRGDIAYIQRSDDNGDAFLYSVNINTGKKKRISKEFDALPTTDQYIYANTVNAMDTGAYAVNVWKVTNSSIKKVGKLGKHVLGTHILDGHVYFGKYKSISQKNVSVYRANLDGSHPKKLFTVKGKGKYAQTTLFSVKKDKIKVSSSDGDTRMIYTYDTKTKKITKKKG